MPTARRLIPLPQVEEMTGLRRTAIYQLSREGQFPKPRKVTERATRWLEAEVIAWIDSLPTGTTRSPNPRTAA